MRWLDKHARHRDRLSPYLDGALSPTETRELEAHLTACEACRVELDQLRSIVAATRDLPESDAPRSFAITAEMLEDSRAVAASPPAAPPLALGMRLASAGVAIMLAVVVIGDLSDAGGGPESAQLGDESRTAGEFSAIDEFPAEGDSGAAAPVPETADSAQQFEAPARDAGTADGGGTSACPQAAAPTEATAGGGAAGGAGGPAASPATTPVPRPPASATPELGAAQADPACPADAPAIAVAPTTTPAAEPRPADLADDGVSGERAAGAEDDGGGGGTTLRVLEIVLAGSLILLIGGVALEVLLRRRRAA